MACPVTVSPETQRLENLLDRTLVHVRAAGGHTSFAARRSGAIELMVQMCLRECARRMAVTLPPLELLDGVEAEEIDLDDRIAADLSDSYVRNFTDLTPSSIPHLVDRIRSWRGDEAGWRERLHRRDTGSYYTPANLAQFAAQLALGPAAGTRDRAPTVLDPAVGAGMFLVTAGDVLCSSGLPRSVALRHLFGVDTDRAAVRYSRLALWLWVGGGDRDIVDLLRSNIKLGDSIAWSMKDWQASFPVVAAQHGFDRVVTNPPWNGLRATAIEIRRYAKDQEAVSAHDAEPLSSYLQTRSAYASQVRQQAVYQLQGSQAGAGAQGDSDLYKMFVERAFQLVAPGGNVTMVVPASILRTKGAAALRATLFQRAVTMVEFVNKKRIFPIHPMFRFVLFSASPAANGNGGLERFFGLAETVEQARDGITHSSIAMPLASLARIGGQELSVPAAYDRESLAILERLQLSFETVDRSRLPFAFRRELDMTLNRDLFHRVDNIDSQQLARQGEWLDVSGGRLMPVIEGRMIQQYDFAAKSYVTGEARQAVWRPNDQSHARPQWLIREDDARTLGWQSTWRAGYCDVTGHANARTVLASIIPPDVVCGNKVPTLSVGNADVRWHLVFLAFANSWVVDWIMRRFVSTTLNFFYWKNLPFPPIDLNDEAIQHLVATVGTLSGVKVVDGRLESAHRVSDASNRRALRAQIDAIVAVMYGLTVNEYGTILRDFPLTARKGTVDTNTAGLAYATFEELVANPETWWTETRVTGAVSRAA